MDRIEAKKIIRGEGLKRWIWYTKPYQEPECMAIYPDTDGWIVTATNERNSEEGIKHFHDESEALDNFIRRLRSTNFLLNRNGLTVSPWTTWWFKGREFTSADQIDTVEP